MKRVLRALQFIFFICIVFTAFGGPVYPRVNSMEYSIITSWKTEGSHELLGRKAAVIKTLKSPQGLAISLGSLLGPSQVVKYDSGLQFLRSSYQAGIDCIIPSSGEFIFGPDTLKTLAESSGVPAFISANIVDEKTREKIFKPYIIREISGLRICVIGLSGMEIIHDSPDENVRGIDVVSFDEVFKDIMDDIRRNKPDRIIVAGRIDRQAIINMAVKYPEIEEFITNDQSGGFGDRQNITTTAYLSGKPVYIASEMGNHLGRLSVGEIDGIESREFTDMIIGQELPLNKEVISPLVRINKELERKEHEERITVKTGKEVASILREIFKADVVLVERQSLFYYPLKDSLDFYNVRQVIKPSQELISLTLKGDLLRSVWERSLEEVKPEMRLHIGGIAEGGKVYSLPIRDDREYTVLTTDFLHSGGNGYDQLSRGNFVRRFDGDVLDAVERFLIEKDERIRKAERKKIWALKLNLNIGSNFNRLDVNQNKEEYGETIPSSFYEYNDQFAGYFSISSWNNTFTVKKERFQFDSTLHMKYIRSGYKPEKEHIIYEETGDDLILYNKYTYNHPTLLLKPYFDTTFNSELYSGAGKHPMYVSVSSGVTRSFPGLLNMVVNVGFGADRNYFTNANGMGMTGKLTFDKSFVENKVFTQKARVHSETEIKYKPIARYNIQFYLKSHNDFSVQFWKKFNLTFHFNSYLYRDTTLRKVAVGLSYDLTVGYGMNWDY